MPTKIQLRRGTAALWTSTNPILAEGEQGLETDTGKIKIGNGVALWTALPYRDTSAWADITGKPTFATVATSGAYADLSGVPSTFPPAAHGHAIGDVTGLQTALDGKQPAALVLTNTTASFTTAQESKLAGIAAGATANATDAQLRDRATHTGTQTAATISDFTAAADARIAASNRVQSNTTGIVGADQITNVVSLTQAEYDAATKNASTLYVIA